MYKLFKNALLQSADYIKLEKCVREGVSPVSVFGISDGQKTHIAASFERPLLYIAQNAVAARKAAQDITAYTGEEVVLFPPRQWLLPAQAQSFDIQAERIHALYRLLDGAKFAVTCAEALVYNIMPAEVYSELRIKVRVGEQIGSDFARRLVRAGYFSVEQVDGAGQFSVHGEIIDVFPVGTENCVRIDLFDDEVDSIRLVDAVSMRSVEKLDAFEILPVSEICADAEVCRAAGEQLERDLDTFSRKTTNRDKIIEINDEFAPKAAQLKGGNLPSGGDILMTYLYPKYNSILDFMPTDTVVAFDEMRMQNESCVNLALQFGEFVKELLEQGKALPQHGNTLFGFSRVWNRAKQQCILALNTISGALVDDNAKAIFTFAGRPMQSFQAKPELLIREIEQLMRNGYTTVLCAGSRTRAQRLETELENANIPVVFAQNNKNAPLSSTVTIILETPAKGFDYPELRFAVLAETDIFNSVKQSAPKASAKRHDRIDTFVQLKKGDAVVHENNGVGIYEGIVKIETDGIARDYLFLRYRDEDKLYVPIEQMNRVQKYIAPDQTQPHLSKLGTREWSTVKSRVKKSIEDMAGKLLELYRKREQTQGYVFSPDTPWQAQFEDEFQYDETADQLRCVAEIKGDMESPRVMDRLLCGDVGYGKTEVALRAVFKAVMDSKQAAILAPTTILAQQHYNTLKSRLFNFEAIRCECLTRFKSAKEQKAIIKDLQAGNIDIIVGTHKLLGADVKFKDLGLLVIDEEQRFGVAHKEKIKTLKNNVDVLTLSATPIPRTLNMALTGIRDMSIIETPPQGRYPVQTYVVEYSDILVRDAIIREISRGGQIYFLYNRVQDIDSFAAKLSQLVPQARIAVGHGQMSENALEKVMLDFCAGEYDVLLCTTIIENGVDIARVNTIIVYDADKFGLSQLYQLRGRVGRSNKLAYAYFTVRKNKAIGEDAQKRLAAIEEFTLLGSGFKIALRDLEIRGAGSLLGGEQHGHMAKVGYDLYCKLVRETVDEATGRAQEKPPETAVELKCVALISPEYITSEAEKFVFYRRIASVETLEERNDIEEELRDRFGELPKETVTLLDIAYIRALASSVGALVIREEDKNIIVMFSMPQLAAISEATTHFSQRCVLSAGKNLTVVLLGAKVSEAVRLVWLREFLEYMNTNKV